MSCPICDMLSGRKYKNKSPLCADCKGNVELSNEWDWYKIAERMRLHTKVFLWVYPIMIVTGLIVMKTTGREVLNWYNVVNYIICFGFWAYALRWYNKKNYRENLNNHREKMFVSKMNGGSEGYHSFPPWDAELGRYDMG